MTNSNEDLAQANFSALRSNPYPGRGIVVGLDETSQYLVQVYWIMGRSPNSRNRIFKYDGDTGQTGQLYTEAADAATMKNPALVIYNAMREIGPHYIVSNGDQTDTVADSLVRHYLNATLSQPYLNAALAGRLYEPDEPNFTPRITAVSSLTEEPSIEMSILRKSVFGEMCDAATYAYTPYPGFGHCLTTYAGDGTPLPPFRGDPLIMPIRGELVAVADTYWDALNPDNRVSLAVKFIERSSGHSRINVINKYTQCG